MDLPFDTVTFLFTDIQGSTRLWENYPDEMRIALARHDALLRAAIEKNNGRVFKTVGDAFCAAFTNAPDAVAAALEAQLGLHSERWNPEVTIRVRMGVHTGAVEYRDDDYFGPPLNRVARLMSIGHGSQILVSGVTRELIHGHLPPKAELLDKGTHRLKDLGRPEEVFQLLHPDLPSNFPSLRSLSNPDLPNNLPQQVTSFIGREKETIEVKRLLSSARLVTLTAAGGTGKSRMALQVAADLLDEFPDGVWFVELAVLPEPSLVAPTVARLLNVNEAPDEPILETLTKALKSRRLLLLLDNCEHLLAACAELANALMRYCPGVTLLASSREAMNITGETVYPLHALALPDPKKRYTAVSLAQYDSVQLFLDRATAVRHDFAVTDLNAASLAQLCHRLDGIPLALELAAARVRSLPVDEINKRLDNRFRLLTGGSRNALPRQQTLRALIDWSYDLLNEQEQRLLARLSAFSGGWTLPDAEAVCAGGVIEDWEVFDLLTALSDKSLVVCDADNEQVRFRLLETLREYSLEKLQEMQEAEAIAKQHAQYFAEVLQEKSRKSGGVGERDFPWLLTEADNIRVALDWLWNAGEVEKAATISADLREFWTRKGWLREAYSNLERAIEYKNAFVNKVLCARVLKDAGWFAYLLGNLSTAEQITQESADTAYAAGETGMQADALNNLALIFQSLKDYPRAESLLRQAIDIMRTLKRETEMADFLINLGLLQSMQGKHDEAQDLFSEAKSIYERRSDASGMAAWLCNQSDLALRQSNWQEAQQLAEQSAERYRRIEDRIGMAYALTNLAKAAERQEKYATVDAAVREAVAICVDTNLRDLLPMLLITQAGSYLAQSQIKNSAILLAGAVRLRTLLNIPSTSEEQHDLYLIADIIREQQLDESFAAARAQFFTFNMDELLSQLLPLF